MVMANRKYRLLKYIFEMNIFYSYTIYFLNSKIKQNL